MKVQTDEGGVGARFGLDGEADGEVVADFGVGRDTGGDAVSAEIGLREVGVAPINAEGDVGPAEGVGGLVELVERVLGHARIP